MAAVLIAALRARRTVHSHTVQNQIGGVAQDICIRNIPSWRTHISHKNRTARSGRISTGFEKNAPGIKKAIADSRNVTGKS